MLHLPSWFVPTLFPPVVHSILGGPLRCHCYDVCSTYVTAILPRSIHECMMGNSAVPRCPLHGAGENSQSLDPPASNLLGLARSEGLLVPHLAEFPAGLYFPRPFGH